MALRPLFLLTGNTDYWSDPKGEFLAAVTASPVYELLGEEGLINTEIPAAGEPILSTLGYLIHDGGYGTLPPDYPAIIKFIKTHIQPAP